MRHILAMILIAFIHILAILSIVFVEYLEQNTLQDCVKLHNPKDCQEYIKQ